MMNFEEMRKREEMKEEEIFKTAKTAIDEKAKAFTDFIITLETTQDTNNERRYIYKNEDDKVFDNVLDEGYKLYDELEKEIEKQGTELAYQIKSDMEMVVYKARKAMERVIGKECKLDDDNFIDFEELEEQITEELKRQYEHLYITTDFNDTEIRFDF